MFFSGETRHAIALAMLFLSARLKPIIEQEVVYA